MVYSPQNGYITNANPLVVRGETEPEVYISINGEEIVHYEAGQFETSIYLAPGVNTITISATKKHGKTTTETRHVILKESDKFSYNR